MIIPVTQAGSGGKRCEHHISEKLPNLVSVIHTFEDPTQSGLTVNELGTGVLHELEGYQFPEIYNTYLNTFTNSLN